MMRRWLLLLCLLLALPLGATGLPYDEKADAHADIRHALATAQQQDKNVLVVFGANWCPECRRLDKEIADDRTALKQDDFVMVKVDVGNFNKNTDLTTAYGNVTKKGIPAAVILTPGNEVVFRGRLAHLTSPYKRYLRPAFYAAVAIGLVAMLGGIVYFFRRRRSTVRETGPQPMR